MNLQFSSLAGCVACLLGWTGTHTAAQAEVSLITFVNSPGLSEVFSVNQGGLILGRYEVADAGVLSMETYLRQDDRDRSVPILDGFTHVEAQAISDSDHVVGFATRPPGHPDGNQRAFVWTVTQPSANPLPLPEGFRGSCAFDITQDGRRVSGYVLGRDPARLIPCVWEKQAEEWNCQLLPVFDEYNPLLVSARVMISDDGQIIAASLVTGVTLDQLRTYGLCIWKTAADGAWRRQQVFDQAVYLGDVNDAGAVAGRVLENGKRRAFVYKPHEGGQILPLPGGRDSAYATDINRFGQVVGVSEDPPGPEGTMSGFLWHENELRELPFPIKLAASTANTITDQGQIGGLLVREATATEPEAEGTHVESYVLRIDVPE